MKKLKKWLLMALSLGIAVAFSVACGGKKDNGDSSDSSSNNGGHVCIMDGEWVSNSSEHWLECTCGEMVQIGDHSGEAEVCGEKPVCDTCGASFGEPADHIYGELSDGEFGEAYYCDCGAHITNEDLVDFIVEVKSGKDPVVLQLSDTQICNWGDLNEWCYKYVRETVEGTRPDLIILTGDLVYGRYDPNGALLKGLINFMETLDIPWAPVFGNHDNESLKGVDWQCAQLEAAENCLFKQGDVTGNGNYSVGIEQSGELLRVFYMMDSNGCGAPMIDQDGNPTVPDYGTNEVKIQQGFSRDQVRWYTQEINAIHAVDSDVKISMAYHIQQKIFEKAFKKYDEYDGITTESALNHPLNLDKMATADETDFGYLGRPIKGGWDNDYTIFNGMKELGVDSIFVGHEHCNSSSIVYEGVRLQYGQKSSTYDRYNSLMPNGTITGGHSTPTGATPLIGGTVIPVSAEDGSIGKGYIYYYGNPFGTNPELPDEPDEPDNPGDGHVCITDGEWKSNKSGHWLVCTCGEMVQFSAHSGGTPNCGEKPVCDTCGNSYGTEKEHEYGDLTDGEHGIAYYCTCGDYLTNEDLVDFVVEVESGKDPVVLQLSDTQICNWGDLNEWCYKYVKETVEATNPDLILITGDVVYGKFDPNGTLLTSLINFMETLDTPWAPVFGNHDNESLMGVDWQCAQLEAAENCLFKQGDITGNGNYSVGIEQDGELLRVFYMMDSNGCGSPMIDQNGNATIPEPGTNEVRTSAGFSSDQVMWFTREIERIHALDEDVKISFAFHIQPLIFKTAFEKYDEYNGLLVDGSNSELKNPLNLDTMETADDTDFGYLGRIAKGPWDVGNVVFNKMKTLGTDSIFVGHEHCNSVSIVYEGVRFQYGQKSSTYDRFNWVTREGTIGGGYMEAMPAGATPLMGGTVIPISSEDGSIGTGYIAYYGDPFGTESNTPENPDSSSSSESNSEITSSEISSEITSSEISSEITSSGNSSESSGETGGEGEHVCITDGEWQFDETGHWLVCTCGEDVQYAEHDGATAGCGEKPVCDTCGETFGEPGDHTYGTLTDGEFGKAYYCTCGDYLTNEDLVDFVVKVESGKDPVVLQLSDTQVVWYGDTAENQCYRYIREVVEETQPDLIILTGDVVYGKFDPEGNLLTNLINFMEGFDIPWAPVFGNHDNESLMGVDWQCAQFEAAENCLFKQGDITGNGNYSVGIEQDGELLRVFYMMDSNGCGSPMIDQNGVHTVPAAGTNVVKTSQGFGQDQIDWYTQEINAIHAVDADVKISMAYHIQQAIFAKAFEKYDEYDGATTSGVLNNPLNLDTMETADETDFGYLGRPMKGGWDYNYAIFNDMKALGVDSIFVGHEHCNSASIVYEGVRFQYGQKSSTYDRFNWVTEDGTIAGGYIEAMPMDAHRLMGGTVIPISSEDGSIGTGYICYYGDPFYFEPEPEPVPVNGLELSTDDLQAGSSMTLQALAFDETVNAYKITSASNSAKLFFDTALAIANDVFTFAVYIPEDSPISTSVEFYLRVKPNGTLTEEQGCNDGKYIYYSSTTSNSLIKVNRGAWTTLSVDISKVGSDCTEFAFMFDAGAVVWFKDIAFTELPDGGDVGGEETPEEIVVDGLQYGTDLTAQSDGSAASGSVQAVALDDGTNAYYIVSGTTYNRMYINVALLKGKTQVSFDILVTEEATDTSGNATQEFAIRVKPNQTEETMPGVNSGYLWFDASYSGERHVAIGEWQTIVIDISAFADACTEFGIYFVAGNNGAYIKNVAVS